MVMRHVAEDHDGDWFELEEVYDPAPGSPSNRFAFPYFAVTRTSILRFFCLPSSVEFSATGCLSPYPSP